NARDAVLAPAVGARAGMIMREEIPGVTARAVVLAHGAPLAFAEVRSPLLPRDGACPRFFEPTLFSGHHRSLSGPLEKPCAAGRCAGRTDIRSPSTRIERHARRHYAVSARNASVDSSRRACGAFMEGLPEADEGSAQIPLRNGRIRLDVIGVNRTASAIREQLQARAHDSGKQEANAQMPFEIENEADISWEDSRTGVYDNQEGRVMFMETRR